MFIRLVAIMLGRLEMTVEECIERFCAYSDAVFIRSSLRTKTGGGMASR